MTVAAPAARLLVNLDVDDLDRAVDFYARGLGLKPGRRLGPDAVEMLGAAVPLYLLRKHADTAPFAGSPTTRDYRRHWTPVHLDFAVDDIEAAVRRAEGAGALREGPILDRRWGRMALMSDPFGHGFCILQFRGRGYDEITG